MTVYTSMLLTTACNPNLTHSSGNLEVYVFFGYDMFLWIYFSCTGSDFALLRRQPPIPGVDDFPRIIDGFYYIFDEMAENRSQRFMVLNEMFNGTQRWQTFSLPIYVDDVPEGVEELNLTLSLVLDPTLPAGSVNVTPAVATVRIQDFSCKLRDRSRT